MADRRHERLAALRQRLAADGYDGLLVLSLPNIRYLTGFSGSSAVLLVSAGSALFLSDFRYREQAREEVGDLARISVEGGNPWERLFALLPEFPGARRLAFEADAITAYEARRLARPASGDCTFEPVTGLVEALRAVKAPEEIEAIRAAASLAVQALEQAMAGVRPGRTEGEVAADLEAALRRGGSEWYAFPTIIASGPRSALPHARTSRRVIAPGDYLLVDFGAVVDGYCSDVTRTFVVGAAPTDRQREVYEAVRAAQAAAVAGLRAGLTGRQADALAREPLTAAGFGEAFGHSLGHGIGLEVHEAPRLAQTADATLPAAAVVTVEPGAYLEGWGGVRIEDDVVLRPGGADVLTDFPRELQRLG